MSEGKTDLRKYQLIKFIGSSKNDVLDIDRVPRQWVRYDTDKGQTVAKFPPPPYSKQKHKVLDMLLKTAGSPVPSWPEYAVELVGHADTYKESSDRLITLETRPFAYTSDSDTAPHQKAFGILEQLKKQSISQVMEVPKIEDSSTNSDYSIGEEDSRSSNSHSRSAVASLKQMTKFQGTEKKHIQKKKVFKIQHNKVSKSSKSKESISPNISPLTSEKSVKTISASSQEVVHRIVGKNANLCEGAFIVGESGELQMDEQSTSNKNLNPIDPTQKLAVSKNPQDRVHRLVKSTNFEQRLSKMSDALTSVDKASYSKDTLLILSTLKGLSVDLKENTNAINNLCEAIENSKTPVQITTKPTALVLDTNFDLPFKTLEEFKKFDVQLQGANYREHCAASLLFYIDRENHVTKSITNILKKFVGRNVCMHFTAVKQMGDKEVFKNTKFSNVMFEVVTNHHTDNQGNTISEKYFFHCLGQAIANSKDWDGYRIERSNKEKTKQKMASK